MRLGETKKRRYKEKINFIVCPYCGYNNEFYRFQNYGTCLRCHKVIDPKVYLKRKLWEANNKRFVKEDINGRC